MIAMEFEHGLEANPLTISWLQGRKVESGQVNTDHQRTLVFSEERKSHSQVNLFTELDGADWVKMGQDKSFDICMNYDLDKVSFVVNFQLLRRLKLSLSMKKLSCFYQRTTAVKPLNS